MRMQYVDISDKIITGKHYLALELRDRRNGICFRRDHPLLSKISLFDAGGGQSSCRVLDVIFFRLIKVSGYAKDTWTAMKGEKGT